MSSDDHITVRDWRCRKPPLRLRVTKKLDIHWCWIRHALPAHARGRDCAVHHPVGPDGWQEILRRAACCTNYGKGAWSYDTRHGTARTWLGANADQPDGAGAAA